MAPMALRILRILRTPCTQRFRTLAVVNRFPAPIKHKPKTPKQSTKPSPSTRWHPLARKPMPNAPCHRLWLVCHRFVTALSPIKSHETLDSIDLSPCHRSSRGGVPVLSPQPSSTPTVFADSRPPDPLTHGKKTPKGSE